VSDLAVAFGGVHTVRGVSLTVSSGQTLAVVGESGSGKSLTSLAVMGLLPAQASVVDGTVRFDGHDLFDLSPDELRELRGEELAMIFQDPLSALNPSLTVGYQIAEMFRRRRGMSRSASHERAVAAMTEVGIPDAAQRAKNYPHEFSGGMRQRVMIAMALALAPRLLIADEPTTALDVTVQAQILRLLRDRQRDGLAMIIISHDLGVVARTAQSVVVMYAGQAVESGTIGEVYSGPAHPYTLGLMAASPSARDGTRELRPIDGNPPDPTALPEGCAFHPRCPFARERCRTETPALRLLPSGRASACHFAEEVLSA
jgi:oligopeptide transport system ATP-binding protein